MSMIGGYLAERTGDLRVSRQLIPVPGLARVCTYQDTLQEAWIRRDTGEVEWKDIPIIEVPLP